MREEKYLLMIMKRIFRADNGSGIKEIKLKEKDEKEIKLKEIDEEESKYVEENNTVKEKYEKMNEDDKNLSNHERLKKRIALYQFKEKTKIKGDGNCQFAAIADQLKDDPSYHLHVRKYVVDWLRKNENYELPNGTVLKDYLETDLFSTWSNYCDYMAQEKVWGDHITLIAAAEAFNVRIVIVSSVKDSLDPIIVISPNSNQQTKVLYLSHELEYHYSSLAQI